MMKFCFFASIYLWLAGSASCSPDDGVWKLVWADEFVGTGHPDPTKWGYESGFVRNKEEQFYTTKRLKNARLENGHPLTRIAASWISTQPLDLRLFVSQRRKQDSPNSSLEEIRR